MTKEKWNDNIVKAKEFIKDLEKLGATATLDEKTGELTIKLGGDVNMMEKYGVDMSALPATDDQLRELKKIAKLLKVESVEEPKNRVHADELIQELGKKAVYMPVDPEPKEV